MCDARYDDCSGTHAGGAKAIASGGQSTGKARIASKGDSAPRPSHDSRVYSSPKPVVPVAPTVGSPSPSSSSSQPPVLAGTKGDPNDPDSWDKLRKSEPMRQGKSPND